MSGYILTRDVNEKEWKEGMTIRLSLGKEQRVSDADGKSPFLTLLWFEQPKRANQGACWKVSYKTDQVGEYEYQSGHSVTLVKSFTLIERISPDTLFDGTLPLTLGKAVFHHGFLLGTRLSSNQQNKSVQSLVFSIQPPQEGIEVEDLDAYFIHHRVSTIVGESHVIRK